MIWRCFILLGINHSNKKPFKIASRISSIKTRPRINSADIRRKSNSVCQLYASKSLILVHLNAEWVCIQNYNLIFCHKCSVSRWLRLSSSFGFSFVLRLVQSVGVRCVIKRQSSQRKWNRFRRLQYSTIDYSCAFFRMYAIVLVNYLLFKKRLFSLCEDNVASIS